MSTDSFDGGGSFTLVKETAAMVAATAAKKAVEVATAKEATVVAVKKAIEEAAATKAIEAVMTKKAAEEAAARANIGKASDSTLAPEAGIKRAATSTGGSSPPPK
jgi:hypothetical protein